MTNDSIRFARALIIASLAVALYGDLLARKISTTKKTTTSQSDAENGSIILSVEAKSGSSKTTVITINGDGSGGSKSHPIPVPWPLVYCHHHHHHVKYLPKPVLIHQSIPTKTYGEFEGDSQHDHHFVGAASTAATYKQQQQQRPHRHHNSKLDASPTSLANNNNMRDLPQSSSSFELESEVGSEDSSSNSDAAASKTVFTDPVRTPGSQQQDSRQPKNIKSPSSNEKLGGEHRLPLGASKLSSSSPSPPPSPATDTGDADFIDSLRNIALANKTDLPTDQSANQAASVSPPSIEIPTATGEPLFMGFDQKFSQKPSSYQSGPFYLARNNQQQHFNRPVENQFSFGENDQLKSVESLGTNEATFATQQQQWPLGREEVNQMLLQIRQNQQKQQAISGVWPELPQTVPTASLIAANPATNIGSRMASELQAISSMTNVVNQFAQEEAKRVLNVVSGNKTGSKPKVASFNSSRSSPGALFKRINLLSKSLLSSPLKNLRDKRRASSESFATGALNLIPFKANPIENKLTPLKNWSFGQKTNVLTTTTTTRRPISASPAKQKVRPATSRFKLVESLLAPMTDEERLFAQASNAEGSFKVVDPPAALKREQEATAGKSIGSSKPAAAAVAATVSSNVRKNSPATSFEASNSERQNLPKNQKQNSNVNAPKKKIAQQQQAAYSKKGAKIRNNNKDIEALTVATPTKPTTAGGEYKAPKGSSPATATLSSDEVDNFYTRQRELLLQGEEMAPPSTTVVPQHEPSKESDPATGINSRKPQAFSTQSSDIHNSIAELAAGKAESAHPIQPQQLLLNRSVSDASISLNEPSEQVSNNFQQKEVLESLDESLQQQPERQRQQQHVQKQTLQQEPAAAPLKNHLAQAKPPWDLDLTKQQQQQAQFRVPQTIESLRRPARARAVPPLDQFQQHGPNLNSLYPSSDHQEQHSTEHHHKQAMMSQMPSYLEFPLSPEQWSSEALKSIMTDDDERALVSQSDLTQNAASQQQQMLVNNLLPNHHQLHQQQLQQDPFHIAAQVNPSDLYPTGPEAESLLSASAATRQQQQRLLLDQLVGFGQRQQAAYLDEQTPLGTGQQPVHHHLLAAAVAAAAAGESGSSPQFNPLIHHQLNPMTPISQPSNQVIHQRQTHQFLVSPHSAALFDFNRVQSLPIYVGTPLPQLAQGSNHVATYVPAVDQSNFGSGDSLLAPSPQMLTSASSPRDPFIAQVASVVGDHLKLSHEQQQKLADGGVDAGSEDDDDEPTVIVPTKSGDDTSAAVFQQQQLDQIQTDFESSRNNNLDVAATLVASAKSNGGNMSTIARLPRQLSNFRPSGLRPQQGQEQQGLELVEIPLQPPQMPHLPQMPRPPQGLMQMAGMALPFALTSASRSYNRIRERRRANAAAGTNSGQRFVSAIAKVTRRLFRPNSQVLNKQQATALANSRRRRWWQRMPFHLPPHLNRVKLSNIMQTVSDLSRRPPTRKTNGHQGTRRNRLAPSRTKVVAMPKSDDDDHDGRELSAAASNSSQQVITPGSLLATRNDGSLVRFSSMTAPVDILAQQLLDLQKKSLQLQQQQRYQRAIGLPETLQLVVEYANNLMKQIRDHEPKHFVVQQQSSYQGHANRHLFDNSGLSQVEDFERNGQPTVSNYLLFGPRAPNLVFQIAPKSISSSANHNNLQHPLWQAPPITGGARISIPLSSVHRQAGLIGQVSSIKSSRVSDQQQIPRLAAAQAPKPSLKPSAAATSRPTSNTTNTSTTTTSMPTALPKFAEESGIDQMRADADEISVNKSRRSIFRPTEQQQQQAVMGFDAGDVVVQEPKWIEPNREQQATRGQTTATKTEIKAATVSVVSSSAKGNVDKADELGSSNEFESDFVTTGSAAGASADHLRAIRLARGIAYPWPPPSQSRKQSGGSSRGNIITSSIASKKLLLPERGQDAQAAEIPR